ncbi:MAG TPA: class II aldolase/adducin family protein [Thermohalobaculum sp.]|nr:class II aldolase/adducin family protein [Thermohalobaculum sp.]
MPDVLDETALRDALTRSYRYLDNHHLTDLASGNISCRFGDGALISPTGATADAIGPDSFVEVDGDARPRGPGRPSSETAMHLAIYRSVPQAQAIVHTHADHCVALACCERTIPGFHYLVGGFGGDDIPCVPYSTFGSVELADGAAEALVRRNACLLANHGAICHGANIEAATIRAHRLEITARQYLLALQVGKPRLLTEADWESYRAMAKKFQYG